jgi:hypothetical protein
MLTTTHNWKELQMNVALSEIQLDERAQPRCELNPSIVEEYAEQMKAGRYARAD